MATTTSNFGWDIPQSTDLVKDGATAIATLGQDIDTSMADLKGGTTGQILSKASGTDMDFTWTTPNPGDITGVTAGTGITGGGTSGDVTVSFDVANYGGGEYAAGKNKIINGDFGIWQRGTTFTNPSSVYTADRFYCSIDGGTGQTITQQTFTLGSAPVSGYNGTYYARLTMSSGSTFWSMVQKIEDVRQLAGQAVTFSFWAKASSAFTGNVLLRQNFGSGGSADVDLSTTISVTTSWQRFTFSTTLGALTGKTIGTGSSLQAYFYYGSGTIASNVVDTWGWQVEAGSTATPFQTATGTKQGELAACQRYYYRMQTGSGRYAVGFAKTTTGAEAYTAFPVTMRTAPSSLEQSGTASDMALVFQNTSASCSSVPTFNTANVNGASTTFTVASGLTAGNGLIVSAASGNSYLAWSAEL